jgi:catechol 2,3-dioxygenase-like lactoylglutathione lyase family enzyme
MIDHISLPVVDLARSRAFYDRCLAALGYKVVMDLTDSPDVGACGYGSAEGPVKPVFWLGARQGAAAPVTLQGQHIAFAASSRAAVDAFYREALAAGGQDNGPPGLRPHYHAGYYGAFVLDPDGHRIEAVCHRPE